MACEWTTIRAADFIEFNPKLSIKKGTVATKVAMDKLQPFTKKIPAIEQADFAGGSKFCNGDTIMARITPCLENGKTAFVDVLEDGEIGFGSTEFIVMRAKPGVSDPQFIYYLATSPMFRNVAIKSMVGSSGRQRVQQGVLDELELTVPSLKEQQKIGAFLAALDQKIALNNKINDNLQQQAQAIYTNFIELHPPVEVPLTQVATIKYGKGLPKSKLQTEGYPVYGGNGIIGFYHTYMYDKPQILISCRGAASGNIIISEPQSYVTSNSLVVELNDYRYFEFLKQHLLANPLYAYATGSAQPQITIDNLRNVSVPYPAFFEIDVMISQLSSISNDRVSLVSENKVLAELRDTLLPNLMAGKIKI